MKNVAEAIRQRSREDKRFSIVAVSEGALSKQDGASVQAALIKKEGARSKSKKKVAAAELDNLRAQHVGNAASFETA